MTEQSGCPVPVGESSVPARVGAENQTTPSTATSRFDAITGRPLAFTPPIERRCASWKKTCACGYYFKWWANTSKKTKEMKLLEDGKTPKCPVCGRERVRCSNYAEDNCKSCRYHGGTIVKRVPGVNPVLKNLDDEAIDMISQMVEEDDTRLLWEFHTLRYYFSEAMLQFENAVRAYGKNSPADLIGDGNRLVTMINNLSSIAEKRAKLLTLVTPLAEQVVRVEFTDPKVKYFIKEALRETEIKTMKRVLAVLMETVDPKGEIGLAQLMPSSFIPYLPAPKEVHAEVVENGKTASLEE